MQPSYGGYTAPPFYGTANSPFQQQTLSYHHSSPQAAPLEDPNQHSPYATAGGGTPFPPPSAPLYQSYQHAGTPSPQQPHNTTVPATNSFASQQQQYPPQQQPFAAANIGDGGGGCGGGGAGAVSSYSPLNAPAATTFQPAMAPQTTQNTTQYGAATAAAMAMGGEFSNGTNSDQTHQSQGGAAATPATTFIGVPFGGQQTAEGAAVYFYPAPQTNNGNGNEPLASYPNAPPEKANQPAHHQAPFNTPLAPLISSSTASPQPLTEQSPPPPPLLQQQPPQTTPAAATTPPPPLIPCKTNDKSLYFCLALNNPFDEEYYQAEQNREAKTTWDWFFGKTGTSADAASAAAATAASSSGREGGSSLANGLQQSLLHQRRGSSSAGDGTNRQSACGGRHSVWTDAPRKSTHSGMSDDDLLLVGPSAPNAFEKIIEIILRLDAKGFDLMPRFESMLVERAANTPVPVEDNPGNWFRGYSLNPNGLLYSPDKDEIYIKIHGNQEVLLRYAERYGIKLRTNPLSSAGGQQLIYSKRTAQMLRESIKENRRIWEEEDEAMAREKEIADGTRAAADDEALNAGWQQTAARRISVQMHGVKELIETGAGKIGGDGGGDRNAIATSYTSRQTDPKNFPKAIRDGEKQKSRSKSQIDGADTEAFLGASMMNDKTLRTLMSEKEIKEAKKLLTLGNEGFIFDVPDKMRMVQTMIREPWEYGGCGLQVYEMRSKQIIVRHFFPLHNAHYRVEYGINEWGSFRSLNPFDEANKHHPLHQTSDDIMRYFGEQIAMYFLWIHEYTLFLPFIAVPGVISAVIPYASSAIPRDTVNAVFAVLCVVWGMLWICRWSRRENLFATKFQQFDMVKQETVRDQFRFVSSSRVLSRDIYDLNFEPPLTLRRGANGYFNFFYPNLRRLLVRYLFSYPLILTLTVTLCFILTMLTYWRFYAIGNELVSYSCSILGVITSVAFGLLFDFVIGVSNFLENPRTDTDYERQMVTKKFIFSFFSFYFSMFIIALYPTNATNAERLQELQVQMIITCIVKPAVQDFQESLLPYIKTKMRRRMDTMDTGYCGAFCSILCCLGTPDDYRLKALEDASTSTPEQLEGIELWKEAQRQPYESTAEDYLEITLQFGYMVMFATTFPWAPLCAFLYNIIEIKVDANKLIHLCQRPIAKPCAGIGNWKLINACLCGLSIVTNSYLICILSPAPQEIEIPSSEMWKWTSFVLLQYLLVAICVCIYLFYGAVESVFSEKLKEKMNFLQYEEARKITAKYLEDEEAEEEAQLRALIEAEAARALANDEHHRNISKKGINANGMGEGTSNTAFDPSAALNAFGNALAAHAASNNNNSGGDTEEGKTPASSVAFTATPSAVVSVASRIQGGRTRALSMRQRLLAAAPLPPTTTTKALPNAIKKNSQTTTIMSAGGYTAAGNGSSSADDGADGSVMKNDSEREREVNPPPPPLLTEVVTEQNHLISAKVDTKPTKGKRRVAPFISNFEAFKEEEAAADEDAASRVTVVDNKETNQNVSEYKHPGNDDDDAADLGRTRRAMRLSTIPPQEQSPTTATSTTKAGGDVSAMKEAESAKSADSSSASQQEKEIATPTRHAILPPRRRAANDKDDEGDGQSEEMRGQRLVVTELTTSWVMTSGEKEASRQVASREDEEAVPTDTERGGSEGGEGEQHSAASTSYLPKLSPFLLSTVSAPPSAQSAPLSVAFPPVRGPITEADREEL